MGEHDGAYIWLRQSVTLTTAEQTRTLEIAIPVRIGATSAEVEALLDEAGAGMVRLSHLLDAQVTGQSEPASGPAQRLTAHVAIAPPAREAPRPPEARAAESASARAAPAAPRPGLAPAARPPIAPPAPARPSVESPAPASRQPAAAQAEGARPAGGSVPAVGADLSRPEFIAATAELGLNPRQAMERLGVRSLQGLNLRESLEALRRQLARAGNASASPQAEAAADPASTASAPVAIPAADPAPRFFDEEEMESEAYAFEDDDRLDSEDADSLDGSTLPDTLAGMPRTPLALDDGLSELEDVPEIEPAPAPNEHAHPPQSDAATAAPGEHPHPREDAPSGALHTRERIGHLRAAQGGGKATPYQHNAFTNLVVSQLGESDANALVRGLWRVPPTQLGGEQFDALNRWAKEDTFVEEASGVLTALRDERRRAAEGGAAAPPRGGRAPTAGSRGRGAGTADEPGGVR